MSQHFEGRYAVGNFVCLTIGVIGFFFIGWWSVPLGFLIGFLLNLYLQPEKEEKS